MIRVSMAALTFASASGPSVLAAQPLPEACDTARLYTTADSVDKVAYAMLSAADGQTPPATFLALLLDEVAATLRMPSDLTVAPTSSLLEPVWLSACRVPCTSNANRGWADVMRAREDPAVEGLALFVVHRSRELGDIRALTDLRADPDIGPVLARTLSLLDRRRLPPFPSTVRADTMTLRLHVGLATDSSPARRSLFTVRIPLQLDEAVRLQSNIAASLRFRPAPGAPLAGDSVVVQFVVDATGRPLAETASIAHARDARFAEAVLAALPQWRYAPAVVNGCPIKLLVRQPIVLRVE